MDTARATESPAAAAAVKGKDKPRPIVKGKTDKGSTDAGEFSNKALGGEVEMRLNAMLNQGVFPSQAAGKTPGKDGGQSFS